MRRWFVVFLVLFASTAVRCNGAFPSNSSSVRAAVSVSVLGGEDAALALQTATVLLLQATGVSAIAASSPANCSEPDSEGCLNSTLKALTADRVCAITEENCLYTTSTVAAAKEGKYATVALVTVRAGAISRASPRELRDLGVEEMGDLTPPSRRACLATSPPARSLLDLADASIATAYFIPDENIRRLLIHCTNPRCDITLSPKWCKDKPCATILTNSENEAKIILKEVQKHHLYANVKALEGNLPKIMTALASRPTIACDWALELTPLADIKGEILGPPPCVDSDVCPFETRRILKYINIFELVRAQSAVKALARMHISRSEMRMLMANARTKGPEEAARIYMESQPPPSLHSEVRVAVLFPKNTSRESFNAIDLAAAAIFADVVVNSEIRPSGPRFKVELYDDQCHTQEAYKYLIDAPGTGEFGALSALAGPACGAAWTDVAKQSGVYHLPILAYSLQAPASSPHDSPDTRLQLLAAGDAREAASAVASLISHMGWKRVAAISEPATRPLLNAIRMKSKIIVHTEVPENGSNVGLDIIQQWASNAANERTNIIYLCVEDARIARAALCEARKNGLKPKAETVWLLCNTLLPDWMEARVGENCTTSQLNEVAEGHIIVTPDWAFSWQESMNGSDERRLWEREWRKYCYRLTLSSSWRGMNCNFPPSANAALLFDIIRQWAASLYRLLQSYPIAVDDLHKLDYVSSIVNDVTTTNFTGMTGPIQWAAVGSAQTRISSFILSQWHSKTGARTIGSWSKGILELNSTSLKWYTADGKIPDDGSEQCALQGLADALNADCHVAFIALGALLIAILIAILAGTAYHCKRRAEQEYRKRLEALGMRPLLIKPAGLDRWEIPRERVVINRKLGTGAFGTVYGGHALLADNKGWSAVAVKTLKAGASTEEKLDFLSEAEAMKRFDHKNVVRLLGVVTKTEPVCTVMEFMLYGDLKNYLLARRHLAMGENCEESEGLEADEASPKRLTGMALDVARALSYLAQLRYVHRDVAARNCLVSARRVVKLADFGMTRLVFENDYYRFSRKGMLPVRWMAPESLALGVFSPASDVWSFGVLLYEIVTFGSFPFQGLSNSEVLAKVKGGHNLELPMGLKPQLEGLIKSCWQQDPKKRPTASEVAAYLADAPRLLSPCLDVPLDALPLDADPPWRLPRDQAEARWVSWAAPASTETDTTYLTTDGAVPLDTDSFLA